MGGSETYVRGLLDQYAAGNGPAEVTVLANRHVMEAYSARAQSLSLRHVASYRPGDSDLTRAVAMHWAKLAPRRAARDVPAGLDVMHYPVTVPIPRADGATVVTSHELLHHLLPAGLPRAERAYRRWAYDGAIRSATLVVAVTHHLKTTIVERLGVDSERVEVIYLGIDSQSFGPEPADEDDRLPALPERFLLYPANLWPHKNHERLVEALARSSDDELALVLAGATYSGLEALREHAERHGVAERLVHLGHVPTPRLAALYRRASAVVFPSLYENCSSPPLEAMASGCPVASSTLGALGEICGDAILPFDPLDVESIAEAIDRVTGDEPLRARLRDAGLRQAAKFDWADAARRHVSVYERATTMAT